MPSNTDVLDRLCSDPATATAKQTYVGYIKLSNNAFGGITLRTDY